MFKNKFLCKVSRQIVFPLIFGYSCLGGGVLISQPVSQAKLDGIQARAIGPAGMSGRITAIDVVLADPDTWYIGTASGGLWKTVNGGTTFEPIFDDQPVLSIGAVAICQENPKIIYVGTGEGNPRNSVSSGAGIYKSIDGGKTWEFLDLDQSRNIHRLLIDPRDCDRVYAGAIGPPFNDTQERGLFRSENGGATWQRILFSNRRSGIAELVMDPENPDKMFAAMWEHQRTPWSFVSGGEGSGLFVTFDGGNLWEGLGEGQGLPPKPWGRIGIAIARSNPDIVLALIEAQNNALYRSEDGGRNWQHLNGHSIGGRPFYFSEIHIDPLNEDRVYNLHSRLARSENGGRKFEVIEDWGRKVHADHQAMWIHPENSDFIILGTDGGLYWSRDGARTWDFADDLPVGQFYHVTVDSEVPYNVYGGLQDNGTWYGPAYTFRRAGLRNSYWEELAFNDGFDVLMEPGDSDITYVLWQGGMLVRSNKRTGQRKTITPVSGSDALRFNWNAAIAHDPFRENTLYIGSQFLHKSTNGGESWTIISPDLTTNDPIKQRQEESGGLTVDATGAENHTTITAIAPSPLEQGQIWVGTDDGQVQLTTNDGKRWKNLTGNISGMPAGVWINQVQASAHRPSDAFVVAEDHRRGNWAPYLFYTNDFGKTWINLVNEHQVEGYVLAVVQDPVAPDLLFLGTEFGLFYSLDRGAHWTKWTNGLPAVSVMDMVIHPRENDLVLGTFGRSIYIIDDISPLREMALAEDDLLDKKLLLFPIPTTTLGIKTQARGQRLSPDRIYSGQNRPYGATISFWIGDTNPEQSVWMEIFAEDEVIHNERFVVKSGLNRVFWNLQKHGKSIYGPLMDPNLEKPWVMPGTYRLKLTYGVEIAEKTFEIVPDPNVEYNEKAFRASMKIRDRLEFLATQKDRYRSLLNNRVRRLTNRLTRDDETGRQQLKALNNLLALIEPPIDQGVLVTTEEIGPAIDKAFYYFHSPYEEPSPNDYRLVEELEERWEAIRKKLETLF